MAQNTYIIEGGIGKCVAFTSIIPQLAQRDRGPIQIVSPHYQVFANNPDVKLAFDQNTIPLDDPRITESDNIFYKEPYKSNFVKGDEHLVHSFQSLYGFGYDNNVRPSLYTENYRDAALKWLGSVGVEGDFMLVQFTGGQNLFSDTSNGYISNNPGRNYSPYFAQQIINELTLQFPDMKIIDATFPNETLFQNTIKCDQIWQVIVELLKMSKGFIGIDSCLQHFGAAVGVPGVVVWGNTRWTQFGWNLHKNMSLFDKNKYNTYYKMNVNDPRNIMVDPQYVYDTFVNKVMGTRVDIADVKVPSK